MSRPEGQRKDAKENPPSPTTVNGLLFFPPFVGPVKMSVSLSSFLSNYTAFNIERKNVQQGQTRTLNFSLSTTPCLQGCNH